jgi:hypothetical protein
LATEVRLAGSAVLALLAGTCVYLLDRDWTTTLFLGPVATYQPLTRHVFGALGGALPSLVHAYGFATLLLVALRKWPHTRVPICIGWFAVAGLLEILQMPGLAAFLVERQDALNGIPVLSHLAAYAEYGRFDPADLWATAIGCLSAYLTSTVLWRAP